MTDQRKTNEVCARGTIIVDTSSLYLSDIDIPAEHKISQSKLPEGVDPIVSGLDILPILARHGYRIIIPAMVAYEAQGILSNGESVNDVFDGKNTTRHKLEKFLKDVVCRKYPNISIEHTPEILVGAGLQSMTQRWGKTFMGESVTADESRKKMIERNKQAVAFAKRLKDTYPHGGAGDDTILALAKNMPGVFVYSEDKDLLASVQRAEASVINTGGLLNALHHQGVFPYVGLRGIVQDLFVKQQTHLHRDDKDHNGRLMRALIDSNGVSSEQNTYAFSNSMGNMAESLAREAATRVSQENPTAEDSTLQSEKPKSRVEAFNERRQHAASFKQAQLEKQQKEQPRTI